MILCLRMKDEKEGTLHEGTGCALGTVRSTSAGRMDQAVGHACSTHSDQQLHVPVCVFVCVHAGMAPMQLSSDYWLPWAH